MSGPALFERRDDGPFDGDAQRELVERAARIRELTEHPGWVFLNDYVIARTTKLQQRVLLGRCENERDYAASTGRIAGMLEVLNAPETLQQQVAAMQELNRPAEEDDR